MALTKSQQSLMDLAREKVEGVECEIVKIDGSFCGVSHVAREASRRARMDRDLPASAHLIAVSQWEAEMSLLKLCGRNWGNSHVCIWHDSLKHFAGADRRDVVVWLDRAGRMSSRDQETTQAVAEWVARHLNVNLRMVWLIQKTLLWNHAHNRRERMWLISEHLQARARFWEFSRDGLDELLGVEGILPGIASDSAAVKKAASA